MQTHQAPQQDGQVELAEHRLQGGEGPGRGAHRNDVAVTQGAHGDQAEVQEVLLEPVADLRDGGHGRGEGTRVEDFQGTEQAGPEERRQQVHIHRAAQGVRRHAGSPQHPRENYCGRNCQQRGLHKVLQRVECVRDGEQVGPPAHGQTDDRQQPHHDPNASAIGHGVNRPDIQQRDEDPKRGAKHQELVDDRNCDDRRHQEAQQDPVGCGAPTAVEKLPALWHAHSPPRPLAAER